MRQGMWAGGPPSLEDSPLRTSLAQTSAFSTRFNLTYRAADRRTVSETLADLLNIDGVRILADPHARNGPDSVAVKRYFWADGEFRPYAAVGINRAAYLDAASLNPKYAAHEQSRHCVGMMAEVGTTWRVTRQLDLNADVHWFDVNSAARILRTRAGFANADPVNFALMVIWRRS
jgi:hypothetical protein